MQGRETERGGAPLALYNDAEALEIKYENLYY